MAERYKLRRDTDANWATNNPVLGEGEPGFVVDTGILKIGDGVTDWNTLAGISSGGGSSFPLVDPNGGADYLTIDAAIADGVFEMALTEGVHDIPLGGILLDNSLLDRTKPIGFYGAGSGKTTIKCVDNFIVFTGVNPPTLTGTCTWLAGTTIVTGVGTAFLTECTIGDWVGKSGGQAFGKIVSIDSDTQLTVDGINPWGFTSQVFKIGHFPDVHLTGVRVTADDPTLGYAFDFTSYTSNCNLYMDDVINDIQVFFMDNMGAVGRFNRYIETHDDSYGIYSGYDTVARDCVLKGGAYAYDGFRAFDCTYLCTTLNIYDDVMLVGCWFPLLDLSTITKIAGTANPWVIATGCVDINGRFNSPAYV